MVAISKVVGIAQLLKHPAAQPAEHADVPSLDHGALDGDARLESVVLPQTHVLTELLQHQPNVSNLYSEYRLHGVKRATSSGIMEVSSSPGFGCLEHQGTRLALK